MSSKQDEIRKLYGERDYPAMSHPATDPAMTAVAARLGGLRTPPPRGARILEIGCASGHNLIPLALRWPDAVLTGVDFSERAVALAKRRADAAGARNVRWLAADVRELDFPGEGFDYIIAHGVFSWVPDDAKEALLKFCARHLGESGIATVSFNLSAGWTSRLPVVEAVRRIQREHGVGLVHALEILKQVSGAAEVTGIVDDMLAKGEDLLLFDDFAPSNDPWPLDRFAAACAHSGLRWLGESDPGENIPSSLDEEAKRSLMPLVSDPLRMQMAADSLAARTFRSGVLCRADAPLEVRMTTAVVLDICVRLPERVPVTADPEMKRFYAAVREVHPDCVPAGEIFRRIKPKDEPALARMVFRAITGGDLRARCEPVRLAAERKAYSCLSPFGRVCARERAPLVDVWHAPCVFSDRIYGLLELMNGSRSLEELEQAARELCPDLAFGIWREHLADRGLLVG